MDKKDLSYKEALTESWKIFKKNQTFLITVSLLTIAISLAFSMIDKIIGNPPQSYIFDTLNYIISVIIGLGTLKIALILTDNKKGTYKNLFSNWKYFHRYLLASILVLLIMVIPIAVLAGLYAINASTIVKFEIGIVAIGIIITLATTFEYVDYFIVDKNSGVIEAFRQSAALTKGFRLKIFILFLSVTLLNLLGALAALVGLVITIPLTWLILANYYRQLLKIKA